ncbi:MAG: hypothetical protein BMS9Abin28_0712 [Anaerolineae bacterium]|nr:MAG: hypothetical protein BMS9Abin28_0712 [Anaerolineae bacterium]
MSINKLLDSPRGQLEELTQFILDQWVVAPKDRLPRRLDQQNRSRSFPFGPAAQPAQQLSIATSLSNASAASLSPSAFVRYGNIVPRISLTVMPKRMTITAV